MKNRKKISILSLAAISSLLIYPIASCSCNSHKTNIKLEMTGGSNIIVIDQTNSSNIMGFSPKQWNVLVDSKETDASIFKWEIVENDDPNIFITNGYVCWNNPKLVNRHFKVKASAQVRETGEIVECISNSITFVGSTNNKFEFSNPDVLSTQINITEKTPGAQQTNWSLLLNGDVFKGYQSPIDIIGEDGNHINGISVVNNKITWTNEVGYGTYTMFLKVDIADPTTHQSTTIVGTNKPIIFNVGKRPITLQAGETNICVKSKSPDPAIPVSTWKLIDKSGNDISSSSNVAWSLQNTGSTQFDNKIYIEDGKINYRKELDVGEYYFKVIASDSSSGETVYSDQIKLYCYESLTIKGGKYKIFAKKGESGYDLNQWNLYSGSEILTGAQFYIKPDAETSKKIKLEDYVYMTKEPTNETAGAFLAWKNNTPAGSYTFQVCTKYVTNNEEKEICSSPVKMLVHDPSSPEILLDGYSGNLYIYRNKSSPDKVNSVSLPPYRIYLSDGSEVHITKDNIKIENIPSEYKEMFSFDENGCLVWTGISKVKDISQPFPAKIVASYNISGKTRTSTLPLTIHIVDVMDNNTIVADGNYYGGIKNSKWSPFYFSPSQPSGQVMKQTTSGFPWTPTKFIPGDDKKQPSILLMDSQEKGRITKNDIGFFQRFKISINVPKRTVFKAKIYFNNNTFVLHHKYISIFVVEGQFWKNRLEIYDFKTDPSGLPETLYLARDQKEDPKSVGSATDEYDPGWFSSSRSHTTRPQFNDSFDILLSNFSDKDQVMTHYFGLSAFVNNENGEDEKTGRNCGLWFDWNISMSLNDQIYERIVD